MTVILLTNNQMLRQNTSKLVLNLINDEFVRKIAGYLVQLLRSSFRIMIETT